MIALLGCQSLSEHSRLCGAPHLDSQLCPCHMTMHGSHMHTCACMPSCYVACIYTEY